MPKYTTYQLHQYLTSLNKMLRKRDKSVNLAVIEQHECTGQKIIIDDVERDIVMKIVLTGDIIGREVLYFFFDNNSVFCYSWRGSIYNIDNMEENNNEPESPLQLRG